MDKVYTTESADQTKKTASLFAKEVLDKGLSQKAVVVALKGNLGSGKTTFLQGFARELGVKEKILSPTFLIMKRFRIKKEPFNFLFHFDCYRLKKPEEIMDLGFGEIIQKEENIVAIEWAEKIKNILPEDSLKIKFEFVDENKRKISFKNGF